MSIRTAIYLLGLTASIWIAGSPVHAAPDLNLDRPAFLINLQRFRDAALLVQKAPQPYDIQTLCARATLLLYAGRPTEAAAEFAHLSQRLPKNNPLPDYGEGLCALMSNNFDLAADKLAEADAASTDNPAYAAEITAAEAVLAAARGNRTQAVQIASRANLPLAKEIAVFAPLRLSSADAQDVQAARALLTSWQLPGGVPRVIEPYGLVGGGALDPASSSGTIRRGISSTMDSVAVAHFLISPTDTGAARASGTINLMPDSITPSPGDIVTFSIDQRIAAAVNNSPFLFRWDSTTASNGPHTITITVSDANGANPVSETQHIDVENSSVSHGVQIQPLTAADTAALDDAWYLLTLQPSYEAAEMILARAEKRLGDAQAARDDLTIAAAIDFKASNGHPIIASQFAGTMPTIFPLPDGSHVAIAHAHNANNQSMGIWRGNSAIKEVALTFDDGPEPLSTPPLLDALEAAKVPATFFVVGIRAQASPDLLKRMIAIGGEVEDHTYTHPNLSEATPDHIYEEILRDAVVIRACTGVWPHFLRPPGGQTDPQVLEDAKICGLAGAFWTIDVLSAEDTGSPENVVHFALSRLKPGAVILMHDGTDATTRAIPALTKALRARGYKMVTLMQLAKDTLAGSGVRESLGTRPPRTVFQR